MKLLNKIIVLALATVLAVPSLADEMSMHDNNRDQKSLEFNKETHKKGKTKKHQKKIDKKQIDEHENLGDTQSASEMFQAGH